MKAIEIKEYGPPENLVLAERPAPQPAAGEVLIKVHAAGVNRPDILQRQGKYPPPEGVTDIPGLEVAGEIAESKAPEWKAGERVCALIAGGGYAEYALAPAGQCLPVPEGLDMAQAAALPETVFTVWNNLFKRGGLTAGERALVHGGSSGIGTTAIQMARTFGAEVAITAGSAEKCEACLALGATLAINYKTQDFVAEIEKIFGPHSIDVVLDMVGGDYVQRNISVMAEEGRHVSIAFLGGRMAEIDVTQLMRKRLVLTGSTLRARPVSEKAELAREIQEHVWPHVVSGRVKPVIYKSLALDEAAQAHEALEDGRHIGKIVLRVL